ncbi:LPS export ABC transporter periplasmic protein LptC [Candidatus Palauibacter sp.]|uniref:LPS export ABC transporter periplasmic protein LptC n=1 Tax=Candidatus Palauibacter sp. TaxID=3101350 RepID=UPI003B014AEB
MRVEREVGADCAPARASGVDAPGGPVRLGLFARVSLLPFLLACGSGDAPPTASEPLPEGVDTAVRGMRTFVTRDGVRRAVVEADTAEWREDNVIHLRRMTLTFFDPGGRESTEVTAEFGVFHQLTGDLEAERRVVVEDRVDNQRLETERLRYRNADGRLLGDTTFQFIDPVEGLTLDGTAFESDPALDSVVVMNQEGEMLPVASFTETIPLPAVPAGDPAGVAGGVADEPVAGEEAAAEPVAEEAGPGEEAADEAPAADSAAAGGEPEVDPEALPAPDSAAAADSTAMSRDSVPAPGDSVAAPLDTTEALPDTTEVLPDSVPVPPDTAAALPDSVAAPPDTTAARR